MKLTDENYYSSGANLEYMSVSQYKSFLDCEAATMAELQGQYKPPQGNALIVGNYVHAWNDGTLETYKEQYKDMIYQKNGKPRAEFVKADEMIEVLATDPYCMDMLKGTKEVTLTGELFGTKWKGKIDVLNRRKKYFVDLKTTKNITELQWSDKLRQKVSFIELYDYMIQVAIYAELERRTAKRDHWLEPYIVAVSKEDMPDHAVISLADQTRISVELNKVEENMPHVLSVKSGEIEPMRCEKCAYCRQTKKISKPMFYTELGGWMYGQPTK